MSNRLSILIHLFLLAFICHNTARSQNGSIWYFGGSDSGGNPTNDAAGLDFSTVPPTPLPVGEGKLVAFEGCASISDNNGQIALYTDGEIVFDRTHLPMPNGTGLLGSHSSSQSSIIGPVIGVPNQFYVFTNRSVNPGGIFPGTTFFWKYHYWNNFAGTFWALAGQVTIRF